MTAVDLSSGGGTTIGRRRHCLRRRRPCHHHTCSRFQQHESLTQSTQLCLVALVLVLLNNPTAVTCSANKDAIESDLGRASWLQHQQRPRTTTAADPLGQYPPPPPPPFTGCSSDLDCSLNGLCNPNPYLSPNPNPRAAEDDHQQQRRQQQQQQHQQQQHQQVCVCDPGWTGDDCGMLDFKPAPSPVSFHGLNRNRSSWGGSVLRLPLPNGTLAYAMFAAEMTHDCTLRHWLTNSEVVLALASEPTGPYVEGEEKPSKPNNHNNNNPNTHTHTHTHIYS